MNRVGGIARSGRWPGSAWLLLWGALLVAAPVGGQPSGRQVFASSHTCMACHNGLVTPGGEDVSIGSGWRSTMMANSARDPYWLAAVRRETLDHPEHAADIENECSICHMPMARFLSHAQGRPFGVFEQFAAVGSTSGRMALDGVSCTLCHQIEATDLGEPASFVGGFRIAGEAGTGLRPLYGPYDVDPGRQRIMSSASGFDPQKAAHIQSSELCATCHTLYTNALADGSEGSRPFPEQVPYLEWRHSDWSKEESGAVRSCQSCHMPQVAEPTPISSVLGIEREGFSRHAFRGANVVMPRVLMALSKELNVESSPVELAGALERARLHLSSSAALVDLVRAVTEDGVLSIDVEVRNLAGHKLPSAYPSRRVWLHLQVIDQAGVSLFDSGAFQASGAIEGNDNDLDPARYEPHYRVIDRPEQVQIWESILEGPTGEVTTGLLTAVRYAKDNRLLPRGFDKRTAEPDIAVHGDAREDPDFSGGGDLVRYRVPIAADRGSLTVRAELWYQPVAFRWARNLAGFEAEETRRFVRAFDAVAEASAVVLATDSLRVE